MDRSIFSEDELKLIHASGMGEFPLIGLVQQKLAGCNSCQHNGVNPRTLFNLAVAKYASNSRFVDKCRNLLRFPVILGGKKLE